MVSIHSYDGDDNRAVKDLKTGLESALHSIGANVDIPDHYTGVKGFYPDNIKVNKLAYRVIEKFDLPILRTWYRYGQFEPYSELRPKELEIGPAPDHSLGGRRYDAPKIQDIEGFLIEDDLKSMWEQPLFDFLRDNYSELAPSGYRDLYLANLGVLETLEAVYEDEHLPENASNHREEFTEYALDLEYEIESNPIFGEDIEKQISSFIDSFEDCLIALETQDSMNGMKIQAAERSRAIYHEYVWPWPALKISLNNAKGPENQVERFTREGESDYLPPMENTFPSRLHDWQEHLDDVGLVPDFHSRRVANRKTPSVVSQLSRASLDIDQR